MRNARAGRATILARAAFVLAGLAGSATMAGAPAWAYGPTPPNTAPHDTPSSPTSAPDACGCATGSGGLAFTGSDTALASAIGAGAIGAGGAIVLISRRRRHASAS